MRNRRLSFLRKRWVLALLLVLVIGGVWAWRSQSHHKVVVAASYETPDSRNALRKAHLTLLANALNQYIVANPGKKLPVAIPIAATEICRVIGNNCKAAHLIDLTFLTNPSVLIRSIPVDPSGAHDHYGSGYTIGRDQLSGMYRFTAPRTENAAIITVEK